MKCFYDAITDGSDAAAAQNIINMSCTVEHPSASTNTQTVVNVIDVINLQIKNIKTLKT